MSEPSTCPTPQASVIASVRDSDQSRARAMAMNGT